MKTLSTALFAAARNPAVPEVPPDVLTEDQLRRLLRACDGKAFEERRDTAILRLLIDTGMRREECAGLKVEDVGKLVTHLLDARRELGRTPNIDNLGRRGKPLRDGRVGRNDSPDIGGDAVAQAQQRPQRAAHADHQEERREADQKSLRHQAVIQDAAGQRFTRFRRLGNLDQYHAPERRVVERLVERDLVQRLVPIAAAEERGSRGRRAGRWRREVLVAGQRGSIGRRHLVEDALADIRFEKLERDVRDVHGDFATDHRDAVRDRLDRGEQQAVVRLVRRRDGDAQAVLRVPGRRRVRDRDEDSSVRRFPRRARAGDGAMASPPPTPLHASGSSSFNRYIADSRQIRAR